MLFLVAFANTSDDRVLLEELFGKYSSMMLRAALSIGLNRFDAEDVVGDTFEYVWRKALPKLKVMDEEKRKATLLLAAKNRAKNLAAKHAKTVSIDAYYLEKKKCPGSYERDAHPADGSFETMDAIEKAIALLPPELSETLYLHLIAGFSGVETAKLIGANVSTVHKRIKRGKELLRETLRKEGIYK